MSRFYQLITCPDTTAIEYEMENYIVTIDAAVEDGNIVSENYELSSAVLENAWDTIKNAFRTAWEKIKGFFKYILGKLKDFYNWVKGLFTKNKDKIDGKKDADGKPVEMPVAMPVKKMEEELATVSSKLKDTQAAASSATGAAKAEATKQVAALREKKSDLENKISEARRNVRKVMGVGKRQVAGIAGHVIVVNDVVDPDKIDMSARVESMNKAIFATLQKLNTIAQKSESEMSFSEYTTNMKKAIELTDENIEKAKVEEKRYELSAAGVQDLLKDMDGIIKAVERMNACIASYDNAANNLIIRAKEGSGAKFARQTFTEFIINPFKRIGNLFSSTALKIGKACVKAINPKAKEAE